MEGVERRRRSESDHGRQRRRVQLARGVVPRGMLPWPAPTSSKWMRSFQSHQSCNAHLFNFLSPIENDIYSLYRPSKKCHLCLSQEVAVGIPYQGGAETRTGSTPCLFCLLAKPCTVYAMIARTKSPRTRFKRCWNISGCSAACCKPSLFHFANLVSTYGLVLARVIRKTLYITSPECTSSKGKTQRGNSQASQHK